MTIPDLAPHKESLTKVFEHLKGLNAMPPSVGHLLHCIDRLQGFDGAEYKSRFGPELIDRCCDLDLSAIPPGIAWAAKEELAAGDARGPFDEARIAIACEGLGPLYQWTIAVCDFVAANNERPQAQRRHSSASALNAVPDLSLEKEAIVTAFSSLKKLAVIPPAARHLLHSIDRLVGGTGADVEQKLDGAFLDAAIAVDPRAVAPGLAKAVRDEMDTGDARGPFDLARVQSACGTGLTPLYRWFTAVTDYAIHHGVKKPE